MVIKSFLGWSRFGVTLALGCSMLSACAPSRPLVLPTTPPSTGETGVASTLPDTGASPVGPLVGGGALVLLGAGALLMSRRARRPRR